MIILLSDTHDYFDLVDRLVDKYYKEKIDAIIHCGDVVSFDVFTFLKPLSDNIYYVPGNNDVLNQESVEILKQNSVYYSIQPFEFEIDNYGKFVIMHQPYFIEEYKDNENIDYILYGHTHKQKIEEYKNKKIINPGALGKFRNIKPQYALIKNKNIIFKEDINV